MTRRFQNGHLRCAARKNGPAVWELLWRDEDDNGLTKRRTACIGINARIDGLHSRRGYYSAATVLGDLAQGGTTVRICDDDVLHHWLGFFSNHRGAAYELISKLAPEVKRVVGNEWPSWRARIRKRTQPPPGILLRMVVAMR
jgi:hypothetical protein